MSRLYKQDIKLEPDEIFILVGVVLEIDTAAGQYPCLIGAPGSPSKGLRKGGMWRNWAIRSWAGVGADPQTKSACFLGYHICSDSAYAKVLSALGDSGCPLAV
jgi:hypothetical protein